METEKGEETEVSNCPFCGGKAIYSSKEERINCSICKARVWFEGNVEDEEKWKRWQIGGWERRVENQSLATRLYAIADERNAKFKQKMYDLAKYGQIAAGLSETKRLIKEIKKELDGIDINDSLLKAIEQLDPRQAQDPE